MGRKNIAFNMEYVHMLVEYGMKVSDHHDAKSNGK
jgi:hypothetical protein